MPSVNVLRNVNLANERRGGVGCPYPTVESCVGSGNNVIPYLPTSLDEANQQWFVANNNGGYLPITASAYGYVTGSATLSKITGSVGSCTYDAVYFSGSLTIPLANQPGSFPSKNVFIAAVNGTFTFSGNNGSQAWDVLFDIDGNTLNTNFGTHQIVSAISGSNQFIGVELGNFVSPFTYRAVNVYRNGTLIASNPPVTSAGFADNMGDYAVLSGVGIIRAFGQGAGSSAMKSEYDCLFGI